MARFELTYDVKLFAVIRIETEAATLEAAKAQAALMLTDGLDCVDVSEHTLEGLNSRYTEGQITGLTISGDDEGPDLLEITKDGEEIEDEA